jgi:hypothetical protein
MVNISKCLVLLHVTSLLYFSLRRAKATEGAVAGSGVIEGAVFALFGLLVAFHFSEAAAQFDTRRQLSVEETNAIGTAQW